MVHFSKMINTKIKNLFQQNLVAWYRKIARTLPWRENNSPYQVWISEIMLQQTRVDTVVPYYQRWMETFPDVETLAAAGEDQVLNLWEGLGYYQRAHNLHQAARIIAERYQGKIPGDPKLLQDLPGIGPYTAGAIASIAFGNQTPIIDGNIRRVFTRFFDISTPLQDRQTEERLWEIGANLVPAQNPGEFNQAIMELGALICVPKNPKCDICPLQPGCEANKSFLQHERPVQKSKATDLWC